MQRGLAWPVLAVYISAFVIKKDLYYCAISLFNRGLQWRLGIEALNNIWIRPHDSKETLSFPWIHRWRREKWVLRHFHCH